MRVKKDYLPPIGNSGYVEESLCWDTSSRCFARCPSSFGRWLGVVGICTRVSSRMTTWYYYVETIGCLDIVKKPFIVRTTYTVPEICTINLNICYSCIVPRHILFPINSSLVAAGLHAVRQGFSNNIG